MRKEFVECKSRKTAYKRCPWACAVVKVNGGYMCFESATDYDNFKGQK
jgi:hypothetical protein